MGVGQDGVATEVAVVPAVVEIKPEQEAAVILHQRTMEAHV